MIFFIIVSIIITIIISYSFPVLVNQINVLPETPENRPGINSEVVFRLRETKETNGFLLFKKGNFNAEIYVKYVSIPKVSIKTN